MREYVKGTLKALWVVAVLACVAGIVGQLFSSGPDVAPEPLTSATLSTAVTDGPSGYGGPSGDYPSTVSDVIAHPTGQVQLADDPRVSAGVCRLFSDLDPAEPHGHDANVCVPLFGPDGTVMTGRVMEDGTAEYAKVVYVLNGPTGQFYNAHTDAPYNH